MNLLATSMIVAGFNFTNACYYVVGFGATSSAYGFGLNYYKISDTDPLYLDSPWNIIRIAWLNRLGGFDYFSFNFKNKNTITIDRKTYRKDLSSASSVK